MQLYSLTVVCQGKSHQLTKRSLLPGVSSYHYGNEVLGLIVTCYQNSGKTIRCSVSIDQVELTWWKVGVGRVVPLSLCYLLPVALGHDAIC